jgi:septal ring factor EnvC (AmiA/AmiB activator)
MPARERKEEHQSTILYNERISPVPSEVTPRVLNALDHLGSQRFALPPFSEHFDRWLKDVKATLAGFEASLPGVADQNYLETVAKVVSYVEESIRQLSQGESKQSEAVAKLQQELALCEHERATLENDYRNRIREIRRGHERSMAQLKGEIDSIDKQRLKLLRRRPSILQRILRKSNMQLEEHTSALETKKATIGDKEKSLKVELDSLRRDHRARSDQLEKRQQSIRAQLTQHKATMPNDGLELREETCNALSRAVAEASARLPSSQATPNRDGIA